MTVVGIIYKLFYIKKEQDFIYTEKRCVHIDIRYMCIYVCVQIKWDYLMIINWQVLFFYLDKLNIFQVKLDKVTTEEFTSPFINLEDFSCKWYRSEDYLHAQMSIYHLWRLLAIKNWKTNSFNQINILKCMDMDVLPPIEYNLDCIYTDDKQ